jgi:quercetin dioxygenase-like cupin family protein
VAHTVVNLKELENAAERLGYAPDLEARFATKPLGLEKSGISYQRLAPGKRYPFGHRQKEQEEVYVVVSGGGRLNVEGDISEVKALDAIRVPPQAARVRGGAGWHRADRVRGAADRRFAGIGCGGATGLVERLTAHAATRRSA